MKTPRIYTKKCPGCRKEYESEVRHQKFCTETCRNSYNRRLKKNRKWADEHKTILRMKARSHALAVAVVEYQYHKNGLEWKCSKCEEVKNLEVHHIDLNFLNNTPSNLDLLCTKHHAEEHSRIISECRELGVYVKSRYEESFYDFFREIIKEPTFRVQRLSDKQWFTGVASGVQIWHKHKSKAVFLGESDPRLHQFFKAGDETPGYIKV